MKRKNDPEMDCYNKKPIINTNIMISATSIRNYMLNDPLIDWLKEYNIQKLDDKPVRNNNTIKNYDNNKCQNIFVRNIMEAGNDFENELINIIGKRYKIKKVSEHYESRKIEKFKETIELMKKGELIIYQGVLHNYKNNTFGMPDLIVRSDIINELMGYEVITEEESKEKSIKLGLDYHYKIIDIKHSTIELSSDKIHILNSDNVPAYKGQLYIYTNALNEVLGININKAYIWGKKYIYKDETINFMNKLGTINYDYIDKYYIEQTNKAIKWIELMKTEGDKWRLLPKPSKSELYPNMKNDKCVEYNAIKNELSEKISEITSIWYCGKKERDIAHNNGIYSWSDTRLTSKIMNIKGSRGEIIDNILNINRQNEIIISPKNINYEKERWKDIDNNIKEFYLDFETINTNYESIFKTNNNLNQYIFMIGLGYETNDEWKFKTFLIEKKDMDNEMNMIKSFMDYVNNILKEENKTYAQFYHWSSAETIFYNNFKIRHNIKLEDNHYIFYDLYKLFINEPIVIKGALKYSLKHIANVLYKNKIIKTTWDNNGCSNGLIAMIYANEIYEKGEDVYKNEKMKEIIKYNEIDCKVLYEIHKFIKRL